MKISTALPRLARHALLPALLFAAPAPLAHAASFDCDAKGLAADEQAICDNRDLNDLDVKMVTEFHFFEGLMAMGSRGELQDEQTAWLAKRQACGPDKACIKATYDERLKQFDDLYNKLERPAMWR
ncbi:lysozyme inhibitor LprI family protein [Rhizobium sp. PAMB 3174]